MLRNKQYYKADGNQIAVYFMEKMKITQGIDGAFSHKGTKNMDDAGKDTGSDPAFAPYDGIISWKQTTGDVTGILFSSDKPIWTKKFGLQYINTLMWHDNSTADIFKGKKIKQGEHLYDEGTAGHATGNHIHYGVSIGQFKGGYPLVKNEFGNWELPGEVNPFDVFFINDTQILSNGGYDWEIFKEENSTSIESKPIEKPVTLLVVDGILGVNTTKALQKYFKLPEDGIISGQIKQPSCSGVPVIKYGSGGSLLVKNLQKALGIEADGYLGKKTVIALQKYFKVVQTGTISTHNDLCILEIQKQINNKTFKI